MSVMNDMNEGNYNLTVLLAAERAVSDKLLEALKMAKSIIGHPDDSGSVLIANTIAEVEEMRKESKGE